ncbi:septation protein A [Snodgrassella alvi]|uniref:Inner membrane-spanning protein YciB n=1 Tax=Snodgrassella alvi TaxID=1196083 RepID=A0A2N9WTQ1_9NEIS|nr:septation protein A [Snodgrassella alvi]PIT14072.1 septation protein A [Snodgrassella alvi]PIT15056.1 septation protein A [Snodgrassella alvi]PIT16112.1 septation protein A [Snodgrassella alvi]PIT52858.1 septation protein A [Snodgrassella alvi]
MKAVFEFLVVILFFATYVLTKNIILATEVAIVAGIIQAAWCLFKYRRLQTMQWVSLLLVVVMGGATIYLKDPRFIKWKPTALFWIMSIGLMISHLCDKNVLKSTIGKEISLPEPAWRKLTCAWVIFLLALGALNLWVAFNFTEAQWVNFKLFGSTTILVLFTIGQTVYISQYIKKDEL